MKTLALKALFFVLALVVTLSIAPGEAHAAQSRKSVCKVVTNDIGTIIGQGRNPAAAFEDAAIQCFDRRECLYKMSKGSNVDEESGLVMIDLCANIKCG